MAECKDSTKVVQEGQESGRNAVRPRGALLDWRTVNRLPRFLLCAGLLAPALALSAETTPPTLAPDALRPGQAAVVRTVFRGDSVETFDAEIVGVLRGGRSEGDLILARATSERVIRSGVAAGMSGSPVFVNGRLIGALSSGWAFSREPLFGITPIGEMMNVLELPETRVPGASAGPTGIEAPGSAAGVRFADFRWPGDEDGGALEVPAFQPAAGSGLAALTLPLAGGGLHPMTREMFAPEFRARGFTLTPGGRASKTARARPLEPGSAVAIDVMRGDLQLAAIGTVTWTDGRRVLLFGHPFFQSGEVNLPLSTAEIVTIVANDQSSFKLGVTGQPVGVATQDRRAAVSGRLGGVPHLLPLRVAVRAPGRKPQNFWFESVEDRALAPVLVTTAAINSLLETGGTGSNQTLRWTLALHRRGFAPLVLRDVVTGEAPAQDLAAAIASPLRFLFNNPFGRLELDSLSVDITAEGGRDQWTLRSARTMETSVRPGGTVRVQAEIERWRGPREQRTVVIRVPEELPDGRYVLMVGGGAEVSRYEATKLPGRYRPASLDEAWGRLGALRNSDALHVALFARAPELTSEGRDYPELPLSALGLLAGNQTAGDRARRGDLAVVDEQKVPLGAQVRGELQLQLSVDSKTP